MGKHNYTSCTCKYPSSICNERFSLVETVPGCDYGVVVYNFKTEILYINTIYIFYYV